MIPLGLKKVAAMCILQHNDQFLLLKRAKAPNKGMFLPVGGKLEPFETPKQAAIRETMEEASVQLSQIQFCGTLIESAPNAYNWLSYIYRAQIDWMPAPPCDEGTLIWVRQSDLLHVPTPPTDRFIYEYVLNEQPFAFSAV